MLVLKYPIPRPNSEFRSFILMPVDSVKLSVGVQDNELVLWALVDPMLPQYQKTLIVVNTGVEIRSMGKYAQFLGTVTMDNGIVWHIWDEY